MLSNIYEPKWSWAEMVIGRNGNDRNSLEPLGYVTAKIILFLPKADTCISHNRALKIGVWKKLESKLETRVTKNTST